MSEWSWLVTIQFIEHEVGQTKYIGQEVMGLIVFLWTGHVAPFIVSPAKIFRWHRLYGPAREGPSFC
jgi:hypothetical protein